MKSGRYVVDASVAIKLFINEPFSDQAEALFSILEAEPPGQLYVPDLFFIESTNILWKHIKRFGYPEDKAREDLSALKGLALHSIATTDLMEDALGIAVSHDITAFDGSYVALARQLNIPVVSADEKLVQKMADTVHAVQWLGDFSLPVN
ncbi:MAG: PIN domain-containing protein [Geobacter sp.]|nr:MAG: PIN domain-containing protein [Geobacter sp.]